MTSETPLTEGVGSRADLDLKIYRLTIPLLPPSKNDLRPNIVLVTTKKGRQIPLAWLKLKNAEEKWSRWIPPAARYRATSPRRVSFTVIRRPGTMAQDEWNLSTGLNLAVMDELVRKGWLLDDKIAVCDLERPVQREAIEGESFPTTIIEIQDLPK